MRIGIVGGVERNEVDLERVAAQYGHELEFHGGHMHGGRSAALENLCERADLVVICTDVNSHSAVIAARKTLRARGRTPLIVRRLGPSRFEQLLATLESGASTAQL